MNISVRCEHCGRQFVVVEKWAGVWIKCPTCEEPIQVPGQASDSRGPHSASPAESSATPTPSAVDSGQLDDELLSCLLDDNGEEELLPPVRRGFLRRRARNLTVTPLNVDVDLNYLVWRWGRLLFTAAFTLVMTIVLAAVTGDEAAVSMAFLGGTTCLLTLFPPTKWWDGCLRTVVCGMLLLSAGIPIFVMLITIGLAGASFWSTLIFIILGMIYLALYVLIPYFIYRVVGTVNTHILLLLVLSIVLFGLEDMTVFEAMEKQQAELRESIEESMLDE